MQKRLPLVGVLTVLAIALGGLPEARSMPILMDDYAEHPLSVPKYRTQCVICHVHEDGSGALTAFGKKYDRVDFELTSELIREYGNLFRTGKEVRKLTRKLGGPVKFMINHEKNIQTDYYPVVFFMEMGEQCHELGKVVYDDQFVKQGDFWLPKDPQGQAAAARPLDHRRRPGDAVRQRGLSELRSLRAESQTAGGRRPPLPLGERVGVRGSQPVKFCLVAYCV